MWFKLLRVLDFAFQVSGLGFQFRIGRFWEQRYTQSYLPAKKEIELGALRYVERSMIRDPKIPYDGWCIATWILDFGIESCRLQV